jgi:putative hydrolase of the HAD superfamily
VIRAIFLDLDDTLYDSRAVYESGLKRAWACFPALSWPEFEAAYRQARDEVKKRVGSSTSSHSRLLYFKRLVETHAGRSQAELALKLDAAYSGAWELIPVEPIRALLAALSARAPVGIITNHLCETQLQKISRFDPSGAYLRWIVTSEEAGCEKPAPGIFKEALARAGCAASEAVMIGDDWATDIQGALTAGMSAVYVSKSPPPQAGYPVGRVKLVRDIGEVAGLAL